MPPQSGNQRAIRVENVGAPERRPSVEDGVIPPAARELTESQPPVPVVPVAVVVAEVVAPLLLVPPVPPAPLVPPPLPAEHVTVDTCHVPFTQVTTG
jgi:hypothetical protein